MKKITHLAVDDGTNFLELLEELIVGGLCRQVANENTSLLVELSFLLVVSPLEGRVSGRRLVNDRSRIAHWKQKSAKNKSKSRENPFAM